MINNVLQHSLTTRYNLRILCMYFVFNNLQAKLADENFALLFDFNHRITCYQTTNYKLVENQLFWSRKYKLKWNILKLYNDQSCSGLPTTQRYQTQLTLITYNYFSLARFFCLLLNKISLFSLSLCLGLVYFVNKISSGLHRNPMLRGCNWETPTAISPRNR